MNEKKIETETIKINDSKKVVPKNPAENYRKTLFNYDLEISNAISMSELYSAREKMYRDNKTKKGKSAYFGAVVNLKKLEVYLNALKKGKNDALERLDTITEKYNTKKKNIWVMYFINGYSIKDISKIIPYDYRNLKRIIKSMKEDLITYLPYEDLKDIKVEEDEEDDGTEE
ncbi:MAG: hypothetical protein ACI4PF_02230 [Christensenellales bacterium]